LFSSVTATVRAGVVREERDGRDGTEGVEGGGEVEVEDFGDVVFPAQTLSSVSPSFLARFVAIREK
jgi:hypothetical protein